MIYYNLILIYSLFSITISAMPQGDRIFGYPKENWMQTSKKYRHTWQSMPKQLQGFGVASVRHPGM